MKVFHAKDIPDIPAVRITVEDATETGSIPTAMQLPAPLKSLENMLVQLLIVWALMLKHADVD